MIYIVDGMIGSGLALLVLGCGGTLLAALGSGLLAAGVLMLAVVDD